MKKLIPALALTAALIAAPLAAAPAHADTDKGHHAVVTQASILHPVKAALVIDEPKAVAYFTVASGTASVHWAQREDRSGYTVYVLRNGSTGQKADQYQITNDGENVLFAFLSATKSQLDTGVNHYKTQLAFTSTLKRLVTCTA